VTGVQTCALPISNLSVDRRNDATGYVADFGAPIVKVNKTVGSYYEFNEGNNFQNPDNVKADGAVSRTAVFNANVLSYQTNLYGTRAGYTQRELDDFDGGANELRIAKMNMITDADMNAHEVRTATLLTTAASYASANKITLSGSDQWSNAASDPFTEIKAAKLAVMADDGVVMNSMICSYDNFYNGLFAHPDIISRVQAENKPTGTDDMNAAAVGAVLGVDLKIASAQYQSSVTGQTFVASYCWGNFALMFHRPSAPAKQTIALAYTFAKTNFAIRSYFDEPSKTTFVDNDHDVDTKLVAASVGYLITNPTA